MGDGYPTHLAVYMALFKMVKMKEEERMIVLEGLTSNCMRDIKAKIRSEGKCGRKTEMKEGIVKKCKELSVSYQRYLSRKQRQKLTTSKSAPTASFNSMPFSASDNRMNANRMNSNRKMQRKRVLEP